MRKHQYVKLDCDCSRRATVFVCRYCGSMEYLSPAELRHTLAEQAACPGEGAPEAAPAEMFKSRMGGSFDCLDPEYETWTKTRTAPSRPKGESTGTESS